MNDYYNWGVLFLGAWLVCGDRTEHNREEKQRERKERNYGFKLLKHFQPPHALHFSFSFLSLFFLSHCHSFLLFFFPFFLSKPTNKTNNSHKPDQWEDVRPSPRFPWKITMATPKLPHLNLNLNLLSKTTLMSTTSSTKTKQTNDALSACCSRRYAHKPTSLLLISDYFMPKRKTWSNFPKMLYEIFSKNDEMENNRRINCFGCLLLFWVNRLCRVTPFHPKKRKCSLTYTFLTYALLLYGTRSWSTLHLCATKFNGKNFRVAIPIMQYFHNYLLTFLFFSSPTPLLIRLQTFPVKFKCFNISVKKNKT